MKRILLTLFALFAVCNSVWATQSEQHKVILTNDFINYMKSVENNALAGWHNGKFYPYYDGKWNIGYGHQILPGENFTLGLTIDQATDLLLTDLRKAEQKARVYLKTKGKELHKLSTRDQEIILDFTFNLGNPKKFPKFMRGLLDNDLEIQKKEYKRYTKIGKKRVELSDRNAKFRTRYF